MPPSVRVLPACEKGSVFKVRLPIGWVLNGSLSSSSSLISTCFKANFAKDYKLNCQVTSWYYMKFYGAYKQVDPGSVADARAHKYWKKRLLITAKGTLLVCCGLKITSSFRNKSFSTLFQLKSVIKCLARDTNLKKKPRKPPVNTLKRLCISNF